MMKGCWSLRNAMEAKRNRSVGCSLEMSHTIGRSLGKSHDIGCSLGESHDIGCSLRMTHTLSGASGCSSRHTPPDALKLNS